LKLLYLIVNQVTTRWI